MITMADAARRWTRANDEGQGFAPDTVEAGDDTIDAAVEAAIKDGGELLLARTNSDEIAVLRMPDGWLLGIGGDAHGRGAWAIGLGIDGDIDEGDLDADGYDLSERDCDPDEDRTP